MGFCWEKTSVVLWTAAASWQHTVPGLYLSSSCSSSIATTQTHAYSTSPLCSLRCDGPLLAAVKAGHWVLLDELNLAGQSVLEGLNGLLDHRAALFVPELGLSFKAHPNFRLFAAQNPLQEGGGRKGLPKSFLNRFTRVAVELLQPQDLVAIATALHPELPQQLIQRMVGLLAAMQAAAGSSGSSGRGVPFAVAGGPWEFNLRDLLRWCELVTLFAQQQQQQQQQQGLQQQEGDADAMELDQTQQQQQQQQQVSVCSDALLDAAAEHYLGVLFTQRLRTAADRSRVQQLFEQVWGRPLHAASTTAVMPASHTAAAAATPPAGAADATASSSSGVGAAAAAVASGSTGLLCVTRPSVIITPDELRVGVARIPRATGAASLAEVNPAEGATPSVPPSVAQQHSSSSSTAAAAGSQQQQQQLLLPGWQAPLLESAVSSLSAGWMVLLVGPSGSGKTSLARLAAGLVGVELQELALTQGTDTSDLLGSFEQVGVRVGGWGLGCAVWGQEGASVFVGWGSFLGAGGFVIWDCFKGTCNVEGSLWPGHGVSGALQAAMFVLCKQHTSARRSHP